LVPEQPICNAAAVSAKKQRAATVFVVNVGALRSRKLAEGALPRERNRKRQKAENLRNFAKFCKFL
jgi:hypothetical protein